MTPRTLLASLAITLPLGTWLATPQQTHVASELRAGWSTGLRVDRPFHQVGDTLRVQGDLSNFSGQDAYGRFPVVGGNGCTFQTTIKDILGNVVWEPGSIVNGMFQGPGCLFGTTIFSLTSRTKRLFQVDVPLIYQNRGGFGILGDPLPPGIYTVDMQMNFGGPSRTQFDTPGHAAKVSLPIRIE